MDTSELTPPRYPLQELPVVGLAAKKLDRVVGEKGLLPVVADAAKKLDLLVELKYANEQTREALATKPVLLVANHPSEFDALALLVALSQEQGICAREGKHGIAIVSVDDLVIWGEHINKHLLPISLNQERAGTDQGWWKNYLAERIPANFRKNMIAVLDAAARLNEGGLVAFFPGGSNRDNSAWNAGIGKLLEHVTNPDAVLMMANIEHTTNDDPKKIWPVRLVTGKGKYRPSLTFGVPRNIQEIQQTMKGKKSAQVAEELRQLAHTEFSRPMLQSSVE